MTGVGTPELAAKMSEAGGLGVFAIHNAGGATDEEMIENGRASCRRDCHFADSPSPSLLKRLLKGEGVQQNDSLADS